MDQADPPKGERPEDARVEKTRPEAEPTPPGETPASQVEAAPRKDSPPSPETASVPVAAAAPPAKAAAPEPRVELVRRPSLAARLSEPEEVPIELPERTIRSRTRRDFLFLGAGTLAAAGAFWWLMPDETKLKHLTPGLRDWLDSLEGRIGADRDRRERFLNRVLTFDDDVAEALYSPTR